MLPIRDTESETLLPTLTVSALYALAVLTFLHQLHVSGPGLLTGGHSQDATSLFLQWGFVPAAPAWTALLSYPFVHTSTLHLAANLLVLWVFGPPLERRAGPAAFAVLYIASAAAAAAVHLLHDPSSPNPLVGASGAASGVLGAYALACPTNRIAVITALRTTHQAPALLLIAAWIIWQLAQPLIGAPAAAALPAHAGGLAAGIALTAAVRLARR